MKRWNIAGGWWEPISRIPLVQAFAHWAGAAANNRAGKSREASWADGQLRPGRKAPEAGQAAALNSAPAPAAILIPVDLSPASLEAVKCGLNVARRARCPAVIVHAVHLNLAPFGPANPAKLTTALCEEAAAKTREILNYAQATGVEATCVVEAGAPAAVIKKIAGRCHAALIVMTKQPRGRLARFWGNRIAERVIREAQCPVMLLQIDAAKG